MIHIFMLFLQSDISHILQEVVIKMGEILRMQRLKFQDCYWVICVTDQCFVRILKGKSGRNLFSYLLVCSSLFLFVQESKVESNLKTYKAIVNTVNVFLIETYKRCQCVVFKEEKHQNKREKAAVDWIQVKVLKTNKNIFMNRIKTIRKETKVSRSQAFSLRTESWVFSMKTLTHPLSNRLWGKVLSFEWIWQHIWASTIMNILHVEYIDIAHTN